ncbi:DUF4198 domain-containing protein [Marivivens donghaensis]|uniref:DUF4198 domain-containing protein n=1 Tax=Marivivens donghaensis TaxID=1699413 RepID=UPI00201FA488|nr:DUF4198 domain-containing protein [Marivivens donghaensis]MCL7409945.1 DUF4198 domain-containing protein [Marivivens donghaensis]MDN3705454.1 DUF4198 domain-containing protein [Marivivens donghaensis]
MRIASLALLLLATPALSHELWLEPLAYQVSSQGRIEANIVNGQNFEGPNLVYLPQRFERFEVISLDLETEVAGRAGDRPALAMDAPTDGLQILVYQSTPTLLNYENWEKFARFVEHKDLGIERADHDARGIPDTNFKETYIRFSKSLVGVADAAGTDRRVGLETEVVALMNPYTDDLSNGFAAQLFYHNDVRANEQVEVFDKAPDGTVTIERLRTDDQGIVTLPVTAGHAYMLDAVVIREPSEDDQTEAVYETLWANLTFAVPE